ncbi:MAG: hypothetical protein COC11_00575 [Candidatus Neomarinimicrobiota bacterium]|jgi:hypothetical protein|nr:MAG: hypothetical protein COC11_00575 [Candidatus Neomarinimicrobiota bacterium]
MLGQSQFYHETIRKLVVAFGSMFNDIQLVRKNNAGVITQSMKVPLAYGPKQKFLARLRLDATLDNKVSITLPRIGFEITGLTYDPTRKLNRVQKFKKIKSGSDKRLETQYMPVPYNLEFALNIMSKNSDDGLQILEQILPYFQPDYTVTINDNVAMNSKRDIPIILNGITYEDSYEGDYASRRSILYNLAFTLKFYLYGPVTSTSVIKTVQVDQYVDMPDKSPTREQRYTVTPVPTSADADDDFGFNETTSFYQDAKDYNPTTGSDE